MEVILLERIARLGQMGDVVRVKDGYARNYLLPRGKALRANEANKKRFESERSHLEARNLERRQEAEAVSGRIAGQTFAEIGYPPAKLRYLVNRAGTVGGGVGHFFVPPASCARR